MKKLLLLLPVFIFFFSCGDGKDKEPTVPVPTNEEVATRRAKLDERDKKEKKDRIDCNWGLDSNHFKKQKKRDEEFNLDSTISAAPIKANRGKKPTATTDPVPPPPTTSGGGCIYVNTYGREVSGTMWNVYGAFTVGHSGFADPEIFAIRLGVAGHFNPWYVTVTTDENVFKSYSIGKKQEIILTEDNEWYGNGAGGVAYLGSYSWTSPAPGFVFTKLLGYNVHNVIEATAHETGHTLGLRHAVDCLGGVITNGYSVGWTMGNSYPSFPKGEFGTHLTSGCVMQDDIAIITAKLSKNPLIAYNSDGVGVACISMDDLRETMKLMIEEDEWRISMGYYRAKKMNG